jgi:integrase
MAGQGSLYQRKSNSKWYLILNTGERDENGRYKQKWIDLETTDKRIAQSKRIQIIAERDKKGRLDLPSNQTFGEWLTFWLEEVKRPRNKKGEPLKPKAYDDYEYIIRVHIKPNLGQIPLKKLTSETLQRFYNSKQNENKLGFKKDKEGNRLPSEKPLSPRTLQKIQMIIRASLQTAVKLKKIPENPDLSLDRINYKSPKAKFLTSDELPDLLKKIRSDRWYGVYVTCSGSGTRLGEVSALRENDIDYKNWKIKIDESRELVRTHAEIGKKQKVIEQTTKSGKERTIPVPKDVIVILRYWRWKKKKEKEYAGEFYIDSDLIFVWDDGRPVNPKYLSDHFIALMKKHGYEGITLHKLRHSYATMLLEKGENTRVIQEQLGHARDEITQIYAHVIESMKKSAATKIEGFTKRKRVK